MLRWLKRLLGIGYSGWTVHDLATGTVRHVEDTPGGALFLKIQDDICPKCGQRDGFYCGPSGGISTNIYCVNPNCRELYNVTPMIGEAEDLGKAPEWTNYLYEKGAT